MENCLFCKFVSKEFKTEIVFENDDFIIIKDIAPKAKNHYLAIPKKHFKLLADMTADDACLLGRILKTIPTLCNLLRLENGYRLVVNQGDDAGQTVPHLHVHILSGQKMEWNPA
ncbi:MAG: HIT domain-containing protein [Clostridia bacterium]|nr:HIT domain-containing protein [Clostridia bacterium]